MKFCDLSDKIWSRHTTENFRPFHSSQNLAVWKICVLNLFFLEKKHVRCTWIYMAFDFFLEKDSFEVLLFFWKRYLWGFWFLLETDICEVIDFFGKNICEVIDFFGKRCLWGHWFFWKKMFVRSLIFLENIQGAFFYWSAPKMTKCQTLRKFWHNFFMGFTIAM